MNPVSVSSESELRLKPLIISTRKKNIHLKIITLSRAIQKMVYICVMPISTLSANIRNSKCNSSMSIEAPNVISQQISIACRVEMFVPSRTGPTYQGSSH